MSSWYFLLAGSDASSEIKLGEMNPLHALLLNLTSIDGNGVSGVGYHPLYNLLMIMPDDTTELTSGVGYHPLYDLLMIMR